MLTGLAVTILALTASRAASGAGSISDLQVRVDPERREVVLTVPSIHIPAATPYRHHPHEAHLPFEWPVAGWLRGYHLELLDSAGRPLPREILHHAGVANLERRQLQYPLVERLFGVGRETRPVMLPASMGVPIARGQRLSLYYALANPAADPVDGAQLRLSIAWTPAGEERPREVFPLYLDAYPGPLGGTRAYDVPPGVSSTSAEFSLPVGGRLRAAGAHLHDHAVEIRLEEVETGKVLVRLKTKRRPDGGLISVGSTRFVFKPGGLRLVADRRYRVVAVYDNPGAETIPAGAMAFMAGPFIPDDAARWPAIDPNDALFQEDQAGMLGQAAHAGHPQESDTPAAHRAR